MGSINIKKLLEKNRQELLSKQKRETPERVQRAGSYSVSNISIDSSAFLNDWLVITTTISGNGHSYTDSIAFKNVVTNLIELAKVDSKHIVNGKFILRSIKQSLDKNDIYIACDCDDFKFRYDYWATQGKFKWGKLQNSNGKGIRNPDNNMGAMCKHLYALLRSNNFLNSVSDKIMRTIMANLDVLVKRFNINIEEFVVNSAAYDRMLRMNISRDKQGKFRKNDIDTNKDVNNNQSNDDSNTSEEDKTNKNENINIHNNESSDFNIVLQYYTPSQILTLLKQNVSDEEYISFIKNNKSDSFDSNKSIEQNILINNSNEDIMNLIEKHDKSILNKMVQIMTNNII